MSLPKKRNNNNKIILGRFASTYGIQGWIKVTSYTDPPDNLLQYPSWQVKHQDQWQSIEIEDAKTHNQFIIIKIHGYDTPETVKSFTNELIGVEREELPKLKENEYYWVDLIGLRVVNLEGVELGYIKSLMETASNDVMIIHDKNNQERLIPYLNHVVKSIDLDKKIMVVDWEEQ